MCACGGDVRVGPGRCFIFVMKYIKLTYTQARIIFISFRCLYSVCWKRCRGRRLLVEGGGVGEGGGHRQGPQPPRHGSLLSSEISSRGGKPCNHVAITHFRVLEGPTEGGGGSCVRAPLISHLRGGQWPISLFSSDKEGLSLPPPRFASPRSHMCCFCSGKSKVRLFESRPAKKEKKKNRRKCMNGLLV